MRVNVGDIILCKYLDFNNNIKIGMFLVYFHDCVMIKGSQSFNTLKVCTRPSAFQVKLDASHLKFLQYDSYVSCNCQQRFHEDQVIQILGRVNSHHLNIIRTQLNNFNQRVCDQLVNDINKNSMFNTISYSENPHRVTVISKDNSN